MARPAKPYALHVLHGTDDADVRKRMGNSLKLSPGIGRVPAYLDGEAAREWHRLARDLQYSKVFAHVDRSALIEYCYLHSLMVGECKGGPAFGGTKRQMLQSLRMQLGLTPVSRTKIQMPTPEKPDNPWAKI